MNEEQLINGLGKICSSAGEYMASVEMPIGRCYIFGHVLTEGLKQAGFDAREVSGTLILADKNEKKIIYGSKKYKGKNVGDFHTWCEVKFEGKEIIIDPSLFFNQAFLKHERNIKLNDKIPHIYIGSVKESWHLTYIEDSDLIRHSKDCLKGTLPSLLDYLILQIKTKGAMLLQSV